MRPVGFRKGNRVKARILLVLAVILGMAAVLLPRLRPAPAGGERVLRLHGNVDIREVRLAFRVGGRVAAVLTEEGDAVEVGEVLARLDDEPQRWEAEQAEARAGAARARLDLLRAGYRPEEIAQAEAELRARAVAADNARRLLERRKALAESRVIPEESYTDAEAASREADARLAAARARLDLVEAGFRAEEIAQGRAELAAAEAALAAARLRLADAVLRSPADGVVITRAEEPGALVQAGQTVLTLALHRPVWVRAYIDEPDLGRVHPGMAVKVFTDSRPDRPYTGQVGSISPRAEFTPKQVETEALRTSLVYRLRIIIPDPDGGLRQGMPVTAEMERVPASGFQGPGDGT